LTEQSLREEVNSGVIPQLKRGYDFSYTKRDRYNSGTWLHNELVLEFASWVDVRFRREMHKTIKKLIIYSGQLKIDRLDTKEKIIEVEKDMNGYIKYGEIYDYDTLKKKILKK
jgi:hypothetical protein